MALEANDDSSTRFKALWGLYYHSMTSGRLSEAAAHADELLGLAERLGADDLVLEGHHAKWTTSLWRGELAAADEHSQQGISRYDCVDRKETRASDFGVLGVDAAGMGTADCFAGWPQRGPGAEPFPASPRSLTAASNVFDGHVRVDAVLIIEVNTIGF